MVALPRRPFRFSSPVSGASGRRELVERARMLEDLGYATATMADHFDDHLAPISALMAVAEATTTLRVAPLVLANDFRHPAVLAKEAATLDLLSEGRLELGLGAGWLRSDYDQSGIPHEPAGVRVDRLGEAVEVIDALWADGPVHHEGRHYRIDGLEGLPKPAQRPRPPVLIGGGGRRVLELAARRADIVGLNPRMASGRIDPSVGPSATPAATDEKLAWIRAAAGDRLGDLELHVRLQLAVVTDDPEPLVEALAGGFGLTPDEARGTPHALAGPVDAMVEALASRRERWGLSYVGVPYESAADMAPVVAALRDG